MLSSTIADKQTICGTKKFKINRKIIIQSIISKIASYYTTVVENDSSLANCDQPVTEYTVLLAEVLAQ